MNKFPSTVYSVAGLLLCVTSMFWFNGCATIQPGNDPLVVRCEQAETMAKASFDLVLSVDHLDRGYWRSNAPAFHAYCEWLRQPQVCWVTNILPRATAMIVSVNDIKTAYKSSKVNSNLVLTALATLQEASIQASSWAGVITNTPKR